jgi:hypothetical protein
MIRPIFEFEQLIYSFKYISSVKNIGARSENTLISGGAGRSLINVGELRPAPAGQGLKLYLYNYHYEMFYARTDNVFFYILYV